MPVVQPQPILEYDGVNFYPPGDDGYWLGKSGYGLKGIYFPDLLFKQEDANTLSIKNEANNAYKNLKLNQLGVAGAIIGATGAGFVLSANYLTFQEDSNITRVQGITGIANTSSVIIKGSVTGGAPVQRDIVIETGNAANPQVGATRLTIGSNAAVAVAAWANITHTGIVLSGALNMANQGLWNISILMGGANTITLQTNNAAAADTNRLTISSGVDIAVAAWASVTHTGLVLSGSLDVAGQSIISTGAGFSITTGAGNLTLSPASVIAITAQISSTYGGAALTTHLSIADSTAKTWAGANASDRFFFKGRFTGQTADWDLAEINWGYVDTYANGGARLGFGLINAAGSWSNVLVLAGKGNIGIGTIVFDASAVNVLSIFTGTAPSALADTGQIWVADIGGVATKAGFHIISETEARAKVVMGAVLKADTGDIANPLEGTVQINAFDNTVKMYADGAWRSLATW